MKFVPYKDMVLVRRVEAAKKTPGGIIIPDTVRESDNRMEVLAVGPEVEGVSVGDVIVTLRKAGIDVVVGVETLLCVKAEHIVGKYASDE